MAIPEIDTVTKDVKDFSELRKSYVRSLSDINSLLPKDFSPHYRNFIKGYFRAQLRIARGQKHKATEIFNALDKQTGFLEFEERNGQLLRNIDLLVRGATNRRKES